MRRKSYRLGEIKTDALGRFCNIAEVFFFFILFCSCAKQLSNNIIEGKLKSLWCYLKTPQSSLAQCYHCVLYSNVPRLFSFTSDSTHLMFSNLKPILNQTITSIDANYCTLLQFLLNAEIRCHVYFINSGSLMICHQSVQKFQDHRWLQLLNVPWGRVFLPLWYILAIVFI